MEHEVQGWRRWIPVLIGLGLTSLIFWMAQPAIMSPRGATGPSVLLADSPIVAVAVIFGCVLLAGGVALAVGRLVNAVTGLFVLGWGMGMLAMRCATMDEIAFMDAPPFWIVIESLLWAGAIFCITVLMFRIVGMPSDLDPDPDEPNSHDIFSLPSLKCAAAGLLVIPAVWIIAQSEMKGQVFASVIIGSMSAGLVGRLLAPHASPIAVFVSPCVFGAVGQLIGLMTTRAPLEEAFVTGGVSPLFLVSPLDLAAGSLIGVALGVGWAKSFLHHQPATA